MFYRIIKELHFNRKGFTLIELLVVVVIIGILATIAIPQFGHITASAKRVAVESNLRVIDGAINMYCADNRGKGTTDKDDLWPDYLNTWPTDSPEAGVDYGIGVAGNSFYAYVVIDSSLAWAGSYTGRPYRLTELKWLD